MSSQFLLSGTILHHLEQTGTNTAMQIKEDMYVDNLITGLNDEKDTLRFYEAAKEVSNEASVNLREWKSNG